MYSPSYPFSIQPMSSVLLHCTLSPQPELTYQAITENNIQKWKTWEVCVASYTPNEHCAILYMAGWWVNLCHLKFICIYQHIIVSRHRYRPHMSLYTLSPYINASTNIVNLNPLTHSLTLKNDDRQEMKNVNQMETRLNFTMCYQYHKGKYSG